MQLNLPKKILNSTFKIFIEVFITDRKIRRLLKAKFAQLYLKKYINQTTKDNNKNNNNNTQTKTTILTSTQNKSDSSNTLPQIIWQFWDKGIDSAPDIIKACTSSIDKFEPDKKHIILNLNTIKDHINIPSKYYDLLKSNKMPTAHFSDILRTYLLIEHGGIWIDSTILLTNKIPNYILNSNLFLFQNNQKDDLDNLNIANYFILSKPQNKLLKDTLNSIHHYWENNNFLINYFTYLHIFTLTTNSTPENKELFKQIPFSSFYNIQHLQKILLNKYNPQTWQNIKEISPIHKLSYKPKVLGLNKTKTTNNTYLEKLLNGDLK